MNKLTGSLLAVAFLTSAACGPEKKNEGTTPVAEKKREGRQDKTRVENAPKPPSDEDTKTKKAAADEKSKKASTSERNDFIAVVEKYEAAKKRWLLLWQTQYATQGAPALPGASGVWWAAMGDSGSGSTGDATIDGGGA